MRRLAVSLAATAALLFIGPVLAFAADVVGSATRIEGAVEGLSEGTTRSIEAGAPIHFEEVLTTAANARLEVTFEDGTILTIGANASVTIDEFVFRPDGDGSRLRLGVTGAFRFVSGRLTKAAGATADIRTPVATIGIRGTDFWGGPIDGVYGVFLGDGVVVVTSGAGEATLDARGEGVNLTPRPPPRGEGGGGAIAVGEVTQWPADKVVRAFASVAFR